VCARVYALCAHDHELLMSCLYDHEVLLSVFPCVVLLLVWVHELCVVILAFVYCHRHSGISSILDRFLSFEINKDRIGLF